MLGPTEAPEGMLLDQSLSKLGAVVEPARVGWAGIDRVDSDAVRGKLGAEAEHQLLERAVARRVCDLALGPLV